MDPSLTHTGALERRLEVAVPGERVNAAVDERLKRLARNARIKGFRPGKVPYAVVKTQYAGQVHAEAVEQLMQTSFAESVDKLQLRPASSPRLEPINATPGGELRYAAVFEVLPEVKLQPIESLQVERPVAQVTDTDVDQMLERMRKQRPNYALVERAAQATDRITMEYEGRIDGVVFPGGKGADMKVVLGAGTILAELDQALHGMSAGESKTVTARFPENYGAKAVAGRSAQFDVKVTAVEAQSLPALDQAFARSLGLKEGGVEELRAEVRRGMERELQQAAQARSRESLLEKLYQANPLELPKVLVDEQVQELQLQMARRLGLQKLEQMPPREPYEQPARKRVALGLLIGDVVRAQQLKPDRERVEARLNAAVTGSEDPAALRRQYLQSREAMQQLEAAALEDAAIDWMLSQAKMIDKPATFGELCGFGSGSET
jgi:trigger factor